MDIIRNEGGWKMRDHQREQHRLQELSDFLVTRRKRLAPELFGFSGEKRRTSGLRRTEVAQLAGISIEWYTWLEQGRPITVSAQVLERLTHALRLDANEREHLFHLALQHPPTVEAPVDRQVSSMVQHFIDQLDSSPAYVMGERWDIVAWNASACAVFGEFSQMPPKERNAIWRMFLSPVHRQLLINWEENAQHLLAQFRVTYGLFPSDPHLAELLDDLMMHSPEFRAWWPNYTVYRVPEGKKVFHHPEGGCMEFEHITLDVYDAPALKLTVYTPVEGTETRDRLSRLLNKRANVL